MVVRKKINKEKPRHKKEEEKILQEKAKVTEGGRNYL